MKKTETEQELELITLDLEDGSELVCQILALLEVEGQDYIYLMPKENSGLVEEGEFFIYKYFEDENEEIMLDNDLTDDEFDAAADAFDALLDEREYFELVGDEDPLSE